MRLPTDLEREQLAHMYDPQKAHDYYERNKQLKGRKPGQGKPPAKERHASSQDPRAGLNKQQIAKNARAKQKKELAQAVHNLEDRLGKLQALIKKREHEAASENRKGKAKKERAAKEKDKPASAAEKAKAARENEKYRDKHKQKLKSQAKKHDSKKSGGGSSDGSSKKHSVSELKSLATKVKGQIAVAKQKLAAL